MIYNLIIIFTLCLCWPETNQKKKKNTQTHTKMSRFVHAIVAFGKIFVRHCWFGGFVSAVLEYNFFSMVTILHKNKIHIADQKQLLKNINYYSPFINSNVNVNFIEITNYSGYKWQLIFFFMVDCCWRVSFFSM